MSITTLKCIGGPYDGRTIDVNDRVLIGDAPIHIVVRSDGTAGSRKIGEYHVRGVEGTDAFRILAWVATPES